MSHLTELQLTQLLDESAETSSQADHLSGCAHCQAQLAALTQENALFANAMRIEAEAFAASVEIPKFAPPASLSRFAMINISTALVIWLAQFLWKTLFGELIMNAAATITSVYVPDLYATANATFLYYLKEGTTMLDTYLGFVVFGIGLLTVLWFVAKLRRHREMASLCLLTAIGATMIVPTPASALEVRREDDGAIIVATDEVIDDTLLVAAETILIKGDVAGDLVAAGRRIEVDGAVSGNLIAFAEVVTIRGAVGGTIISAGSQIELSGSQVQGDTWAAARNLIIDSDASIAHNLMASAQSIALAGRVDNELYSFAETLEISGVLGGNLTASGRLVRLLDAAEIQGAATLNIPGEQALQRSPDAQVLGALDIAAHEHTDTPSSRYARGEFYLWQAARLISALLVGVALFWYMPSFKYLSLRGGMDGLKTTGLGLALLITVPIAALLLAITLVGIPLSFIVALLWLLLIYLAKIVVSGYIGRTVLANTRNDDHSFMILLVGLAITILATNLPFIGGTISFILTVVGVGLIAQHLIARFSANPAHA